MHIVEVDEHLDYPKFYSFPPSETEITKAAGRRTWELLHGLADNYPCPPCKPVFQTLMSGVHDIVNLGLGKDIHDPKRWHEFLHLVEEARKEATHHRRGHKIESGDHLA